VRHWCARIDLPPLLERALHVAVIGLAAVSLTPRPAFAQNPFSIEGTITAASNSGVTAVPANANPPCVITGGSTQACMITDPDGSLKERGPINSNTTKMGGINTAPTPMLGDTNPNSNTDLNTVFSQVKKASDLDLWYYFAWIRDATGTGFISVEFQHNPVDAGCIKPNSTPVVVDYSLDTCNPWKGRQGGTGGNADFLILWDQSGSSTDIIQRNFICSNGSSKCTGPLVVLAPCPSVITSENPADACHRISPAYAVASFGLPAPSKQVWDTGRGELAIDLTTQVFAAGGCQSFANIIPGTVTGNSDTADYKDVVLSPFPPISNCGSVTITKQTDPQGRAGTFTYTLAAGGSSIFNPGGVDADCSVSGAGDLAECRGRLTTTTAAPYTDSNTISNLVEHAANWTLTEDSPGSDFTLKSIDCVDSEGGTYHLFGDGQTPVSGFLVEPGATTACTIVNAFVKGSPTGNTVQAGRALIKDSISLAGIKAGASDASSATAIFALYSASPCVDPNLPQGILGNRVYVSDPIALTYDSSKTTASAAMPDSLYQVILPGVTYYWRVTYSGDAYNNSLRTACGSETANVTITFFQ